MTLTALLVDDERLARAQLRDQLAAFDEVKVVAEADSVPAAVDAVAKHNPGVVFLDIQMPGQNGFDFLEQAHGDFKTIFVTAFDQFALRAFEVNALDYLLKPVTGARLSAAITRLNEQKPTASATQPLASSDYLFVSAYSGARFIKVASIKYIVAAGAYSEIFVGEARKYMLLQSMKDWEKRLPQEFVRIHRSCIVNMEQIERIDRVQDSYTVRVKEMASALGVSRRCAAALKERFR